MRQTHPPLYGKFNIGPELTLAVIVERLSQVSAHFLGGKSFTGYLKLANGTGMYGLGMEELQQLFIQHDDEIAQVTISETTPDGYHINVNLRLDTPLNTGEGRYVIGTPALRDSQDIRDMILGNWTARPEVRQVDPAPVEPAEEAPDAGGDETAGTTESFTLKEPVTSEIIADLVAEIFTRYLDDAVISITLSTTDGNRFNSPPDQLRRYISRLGMHLREIWISFSSPIHGAAGIKLDIQARQGSLTLNTDANHKIEDLVRRTLALAYPEHAPRVLTLLPPGDFSGEDVWFALKAALDANNCLYSRAESMFGYISIPRLKEELDAAEIFIVDMTGRSPEVCYLFGAIHALGKPFLLLARNIRDIPFDLKRERYILYRNGEEGLDAMVREVSSFLRQIIQPGT